MRYFLLEHIKLWLLAATQYPESVLSALHLIFQKKAMQLRYGDPTAVPDLSDAQAISRSFPLTYGQRLVHFLSSSFGIRDSQFLTEHPVMR